MRLEKHLTRLERDIFQENIQEELKDIGFKFGYSDGSFGHNIDVFYYDLDFEYKKIKTKISIKVKINLIDEDKTLYFRLWPQFGDGDLSYEPNGWDRISFYDEKSKPEHFADYLLRHIKSDKDLKNNIRKGLDRLTDGIPDDEMDKFLEYIRSGRSQREMMAYYMEKPSKRKPIKGWK